MLRCLDSLWQCEPPACSIEVIVVINSSVSSSKEIRVHNRETHAQAVQWQARHRPGPFQLHLLHFPDLPSKHAGVGLARKIGMDEALRRFDDAGNPAGIIVGFDADCICSSNYLRSIERHFQAHPETPACSIYFEHPLDSDGIILYELHLRYYVQALKHAGFPYAHHTLGSCMAVRASAYRQQGGMNKRQAGEDFYFLQKIMALGNYTDLTGTTVFPSARPSDRVPFGTGKAIRDYQQRQQAWTYPLEAFVDLKCLFEALPRLFRASELASWLGYDSFSPSLRAFLDAQDFAKMLAEIQANTSTELAFRKRFFHWFNGFQGMKFLHHARDLFYGSKDVLSEARKLLSVVQGGGDLASSESCCQKASLLTPETTLRQTLDSYRRLDLRHSAVTALAPGSAASRPGTTCRSTL